MKLFKISLVRNERRLHSVIKSLSQLENVYRIMAIITNMRLIKDRYTCNFYIHL